MFTFIEEEDEDDYETDGTPLLAPDRPFPKLTLAE
jgi:hypothetical protein